MNNEYISIGRVKEIIENRDSGFLACLKAFDEILKLPDLYIVNCKNCIHAKPNETFPKEIECKFQTPCVPLTMEDYE